MKTAIALLLSLCLGVTSLPANTKLTRGYDDLPEVFQQFIDEGDDMSFLVIEAKGTGNFVQFAYHEDQSRGIFIDLPMQQGKKSAEYKELVAELESHEIEYRSYPFNDLEIVQIDIATDIEAAIEITGYILLDLYDSRLSTPLSIEFGKF